MLLAQYSWLPARTILSALQELDTARLVSTPQNPSPPGPTAAQLRDLPFLDAILHESLRVFPPAPSGTIRDLDKDLEIAGTRLPKGTSVMMSPWAIHHSTAVWGADSKEWRPTRWLEGRSVNVVKRDERGALRWLPFSDGSQNCIGQHLAMVRTQDACPLINSGRLLAQNAASAGVGLPLCVRCSADSPEPSMLCAQHFMLR
jgi:cytochrome P450